VKTASGATAVQIAHPSRRWSRDIEHIRSAHDDVELELLKAAARRRMATGQGELDLGLEVTESARRGAGGGPLPITSTRMGHLPGSLERGYEVLGFADATGGGSRSTAPMPALTSSLRHSRTRVDICSWHLVVPDI
jgi:hypothetical protein